DEQPKMIYDFLSSTTIACEKNYANTASGIAPYIKQKIEKTSPRDYIKNRLNNYDKDGIFGKKSEIIYKGIGTDLKSNCQVDKQKTILEYIIKDKFSQFAGEQLCYNNIILTGKSFITACVGKRNEFFHMIKQTFEQDDNEKKSSKKNLLIDTTLIIDMENLSQNLNSVFIQSLKNTYIFEDNDIDAFEIQLKISDEKKELKIETKTLDARKTLREIKQDEKSALDTLSPTSSVSSPASSVSSPTSPPSPGSPLELPQDQDAPTPFLSSRSSASMFSEPYFPQTQSPQDEKKEMKTDYLKNYKIQATELVQALPDNFIKKNR